MSISSTIAEFVSTLSLERVPADVQERARTCLLNSYGIALSGWMTPYAPVARKAALTLFGQTAGGATLLGDGRRTSDAGAALANGALFHGRAQEDSCGSAHLGTILVPLLTAMFEVRSYPLDRFLPALIAGYEVGGLFEAEYVADSRDRGLRASPLYGTLAAAAGAAKAMDLPPVEIAAALANAASFTGGIAQSLAEGTDEWRYQVGVSALNGLIAAQLAENGSISASQAFEGPAGFIHAFAGTGRDPRAMLAKMGNVWSLRRVAFKPYPVCAFNQTPVIAALALREQIDWRNITRVRMRMNPGETGYSGLDSQGPFNTVTGTLMSTPFCVATTLVHGEPTMDAIANFADPDVAGLTRIVEAVADPDVPPLSCVVEVQFANGTQLRHEQMMKPTDYGYSWPELCSRLRRIGDLSGVSAKAFDLIESFVAHLPDADLGDVVSAFQIPVRG